MNSKENRAESIIQKAQELFLEHGYDQVSVMDICQACEITKPTFYRYINSKDDVLRSLFTHSIDDLNEKIQTIDPTNYWELFFVSLTYSMEQNIEYGWELYSKYWILNLNEKKELYPLTNYARSIAIDYLKKGQKSGQIQNQSDPTKLFTVCKNITLGYSVKWCMTMGGFDLIKTCRKDLYRVLNVQKKVA